MGAAICDVCLDFVGTYTVTDDDRTVCLSCEPVDERAAA